MSPSFAVLIPAYNAAGHVRRAIDSVLAQTVPAEQVIVCDDGSTDETASILAGYGGQVEVVSQSNRGLNAARNAALGRATTDFVVLLDADDEWLPERLARTAEAIEREPDADIVTTDAEIVWPDGRRESYYASRHFPDRDEQPVAILEENFVFVSSAVRRERLIDVGGFDEGLDHDSEYGAWVKLVTTGSRVALAGGREVRYHRSAGTLSSNRAGTHRMTLQVFDRAAREVDLGPAQLRAIQHRSVELRRLLTTHDALASLYQRDPRARRRLVVAARQGEMAWWKRPLALAAAAAPRLAAAGLERLPEPWRPTGA